MHIFTYLKGYGKQCKAEEVEQDVRVGDSSEMLPVERSACRLLVKNVWTLILIRISSFAKMLLCSTAFHSRLFGEVSPRRGMIKALCRQHVT